MVDYRKKADNAASFDYLGFTFYLGRSKYGSTIVKLKTSGRRIRAKLVRVKEWIRDIRNKRKLKEIWSIFCSKLRGHINYYGVSHNYDHVSKFCHHAVKILFKWLNRRSQRKSFDWESYLKFIERNPLPKIKIYHKLF